MNGYNVNSNHDFPFTYNRINLRTIDLAASNTLGSFLPHFFLGKCNFSEENVKKVCSFHPTRKKVSPKRKKNQFLLFRSQANESRSNAIFTRAEDVDVISIVSMYERSQMRKFPSLSYSFDNEQTREKSAFTRKRWQSSQLNLLKHIRQNYSKFTLNTTYVY